MAALGRRDRMALAIGAVAVLLFLVVQFVIFPLVDGRERMRKGIVRRERTIEEMRELAARFSALDRRAQGVSARFAGRPADFSLFAFLDDAARKAGVKEHIAYMKPSQTADTGRFRESMVEVKIQGVGIAQLVDFLQRIESPEMIVVIKRISIQENKKVPDTLDTVIQAVTFEQQDGAGEESGPPPAGTR